MSKSSDRLEAFGLYWDQMPIGGALTRMQLVEAILYRTNRSNKQSAGFFLSKKYLQDLAWRKKVPENNGQFSYFKKIKGTVTKAEARTLLAAKTRPEVQPELPAQTLTPKLDKGTTDSFVISADIKGYVDKYGHETNSQMGASLFSLLIEKDITIRALKEVTIAKLNDTIRSRNFQVAMLKQDVDHLMKVRQDLGGGGGTIKENLGLKTKGGEQDARCK